MNFVFNLLPLTMWEKTQQICLLPPLLRPHKLNSLTNFSVPVCVSVYVRVSVCKDDGMH